MTSIILETEGGDKTMQDALITAKKCRHYAMCKIDYLGIGVCASGQAKHYVSYYPQGRMDLYAALAEVAR